MPRPLVLMFFFSLACFACSSSSTPGLSDGAEDQDASMDDGGNSTTDGGDTSGSDITKTDGGSFSDDFEQCTAVNETAQNTRGPADVIIAIDNTPSMYNEIEEVRANMNRFSQMVQDEGLDLHIILISCRSGDCLSNTNWHTICVEPPVGKLGACEDDTDDSNPPIYLHVNSKVESRKGLESIVDTYAQWKDMLRPDAAKHVIVVSDDNDDWTAEQFNTSFLALDERLAGYQFHGIYAFMSKQDACDISPDEPCCEFSAPDGEGVVYRELAELTGGLSGDMCLQDFDPVFDQFADAVVASARLNCHWSIPDPPDGEDLDPNLVNVKFIDDTAEAFLIGRVSGPEICDQVAHGWYYDDADNPSTIFVCPQTCDWFQGKAGAQVSVEFGCETEWERPE